ncbi:amidase signature enzyme [Corynespora cassiicola Philippines]|uniref:Amidase signature enzyme n=1 Tax=Corynespora cassiicola Philippines TaxID=1448308 RepID=A0A2T2NHT1_CORCC|nr:amidase signature enzyme [Corynespora cassiicola Philippines]
MKSFLSLISVLPVLAQAAVISNGRVVTLGGIDYYVGATAVGQLDSPCLKDGVQTPASAEDSDLFPLTLLQAISTYDTEDDVFQPAFLDTIFLRLSSNGSATINNTALMSTLEQVNNTRFLLESRASDRYAAFKTGSISSAIPKGPYFVSSITGSIYTANRLYPDPNLAFIQGVISTGEGTYAPLPASISTLMAPTIAVPSRLYFTPTPSQPLAGLRFGIKDIFHLAGVTTTGGNRAYGTHYGPQNATAPSIQRLIDLGALPVGKMGTVQFANGDRATADWVDLHAPFNPRGDGYQDPSGSSTGPGVGVAAYEWLDLAVGSDTGGSMRGPAGAEGLFGNRPSTGAISLEHVIPLSPVSDSAGVFARSGALWARVTQAWYPDLRANYTAYPRSLYRSSVTQGAWSAGPSGEEALGLMEGFVGGLERFLGVEAQEVDYLERWGETHGDAPSDLSEMLNLTYAVFVSHDQWELLGRPFFEEYAAANGGRRPYINPGPLARWRWGQENAGEMEYAQALRNISMFKSWWETQGYGRHDVESCSEGLYIYPFTTGEPSYRDEYFQARTTPPLGFDDSSIPVMAGAPEVVVPIGEVPYESRVTLQTEYLPVTMGLRMARGCDHALAALVSDLELTGILRSVAAGSRLYP